LWSSEDPRYGGYGTSAPQTDEDYWLIQGHAAIVLMPESISESGQTGRRSWMISS